MDFKRTITTLCIFSMILLFVQCEKEELSLKEGYQPDAALRKPGKTPPGLDKTVDNYATFFEGGDISGEGYFTTGGPFTLTLSSDHFDEWDAGTFTVTGYYGDEKTLRDDDRVRILYTTKKKGENRLDLWYTDGDTTKYFCIRQPNPSEAYNPTANTLTFDDAYCIVAIRDGSGEHYKNYTPASATLKFSYEQQ